MIFHGIPRQIAQVLRHFFGKASWVLALVLCFGCAGAGKKLAIPETLPVSMTVVPYEVAALDEAVVVSHDGAREVIPVSVEGEIVLGATSRRVKGMPAGEFVALVRRTYPKARSVELRELRANRVTVLGEVFHQIHTDLGDGPMRVMDAIASANGFTPLANKRRVKLMRQNGGRIEVYELDLREMMLGRNLVQNLLLKPGDVITVPRNFL